MSQESIKLWEKDPFLTVLHKEAILGLRFYNELLEDVRNLDRLRGHKYNVLSLQEEIHTACRNNPKWQRARIQLDTLIEIRYELKAYFKSVFDFESADTQRIKFETRHQEFYACLRQLIRLFAP